jgi:hypothetical protein
LEQEELRPNAYKKKRLFSLAPSEIVTVGAPNLLLNPNWLKCTPYAHFGT